MKTVKTLIKKDSGIDVWTEEVQTKSIFAHFFPINNPYNESQEHAEFSIECCNKYFNELLKYRGMVFLSEVYEFLNLDVDEQIMKIAKMYGWFSKDTEVVIKLSKLSKSAHSYLIDFDNLENLFDVHPYLL